MLVNTFCHIANLKECTEAKLWEAGILSWDDVLELDELPVSRPSLASIRLALKESQERRYDGDAAYFASRLPNRQRWRLFSEYRDQTAYLDIETEGLSKEHCGITTIAVYDGRSLKTYVRGRNLGEFMDDISQYRLLVTYNGSQFDLPMLSRSLDISFPQAHIDLRFVLRDVGITGGLKKCEQTLGIDRGRLNGLNGYAAVLLWQEYARRGHEGALETLLAYNAADVLGLEPLAVRAYNLMLGQMKFAPARLLDMPEIGSNPFQADPKSLKRLPKWLFEKQYYTSDIQHDYK